MQAFLHYALLVPKTILIYLVVSYRNLMLTVKYPYISKHRKPDMSNLESAYDTLANKIGDLIDDKGLFKVNPDHQPLRHGSLVWSVPSELTLNGMENYIDKGKFVRGPDSPYGAPPAMPMSIAHALVTALVDNVEIRSSLKDKFVDAVESLVDEDFAIDKDSGTKPRAASTGFDAIFALSMLYTAYALSRRDIFLHRANQVLFQKGYWILLLAPITYLSEKRRNYFVDHISMFGLRTAYLACPSKPIKMLLKHALKFVYSQSAHYANPYFAALAEECDALSKDYKDMVLDIHSSTNIVKASYTRDVIYTATIPSDFSTHSDGEFLFDDYKALGIDVADSRHDFVPLNGLCLARSLSLLLGERH